MLVRREARRGGGVVLQCARDELKGFLTLEIPEWMFDSCVCGRMKAVDFPQVDCSALLALKCLLSAATGSSELDVVQAQHHSASSRDSDAQAVVVQMQSRRVVFSTGEVLRVTSKVRQKMTRLLARMLNEHLLNLSTLARVVAQKTRATQKR